ncbi:hypothetical protein BGX31_007636 [Mortierella sp. GBA43]|nr:hypothetical protein BGX31_007636 [Mortierella sp. GBA43]
MDPSTPLWMEAIVSSKINSLDELIKGLRQQRSAVPDTQTTSPMTSTMQPPLMRVHKDYIPRVLQRRASTLLGIEFGETDGTVTFMTLTALQLGILLLYTSTAADRGVRAKVVDMLVKESTAEEINEGYIGDRSNALHLAAFLNLTSTMQLLTQHGGDPLIDNGFGLSAEDIMMAVPTLGVEPDNPPAPVTLPSPGDGQVFHLVSNDPNNRAGSQPQIVIPHRRYMTTQSNSPTREEREYAVTTVGPTWHGEQRPLDVDPFSNVGQQRQLPYPPRPRSGYSDVHPRYDMARPPVPAPIRTRSDPYPSRGGVEPPSPSSILKKRDSRRQDQPGSPFGGDCDPMELYRRTSTSSSSVPGKDGDAQSAGSRKSKSVQWNSHRSVRTFRRHTDQHVPDTLETDSIHSVEYEEPIHESSGGSSSADSPAEHIPPQNYYSMNGAEVPMMSRHPYMDGANAGYDMVNEDARYYGFERCTTPTDMYFDNDNRTHPYPNNVEPDQEDSEWTTAGMKSRSLPPRPMHETSGSDPSRDSNYSLPDQESRPSKLSIFKSGSSAKATGNSKPSWWARFSASRNSSPSISSPLSLGPGSKAARAPQVYPDLEEHNRQFIALFMDRYDEELQGFELPEEPRPKKSANITRKERTKRPSRTAHQESAPRRGMSNPESNHGRMWNPPPPAQPPQEQFENYPSSDQYQQYYYNEEDMRPDGPVPPSSSEDDYWNMQKQVRVVMIPPRYSSSDNPQWPDTRQPDTVYMNEQEPPSSEFPAGEDINVEAMPIVKRRDTMRRQSVSKVSDPDYEDMEHVDGRKRYAAVFDPNLELTDENTTTYAFMGEAMVNINRICDGIEPDTTNM